MDARDAVAGAIRDHGPITFAEYMELALYGPGGFFEDPPIGPDGHFVTSPHVHPVFAELLARAVVDLHGRLEEPRPFRVTEVGAGDGTLARQLVEHLGDLDAAYTAVETTSGARRALAAIEGIQVAERLIGSPQLILANELMDNLPFRRLRGTASGTKEVMIGLDGDRLVERLGDPPSHDDAALGDGEEAVLPEGAIAFIEEVAAPRLSRAPAGRGSPRPAGLDRHHLRDRLRSHGRTCRRAGTDRLPQRHAAPCAHEPGLRSLGPRTASLAGRAPEPPRGTRRGQGLERAEPRLPAGRSVGARAPPMAPPGDPGTPRAVLDLKLG